MVRREKVLEHGNSSSPCSDPTFLIFPWNCGQRWLLCSLPPQTRNGTFHLLEPQKYVLVSWIIVEDLKNNHPYYSILFFFYEKCQLIPLGNIIMSISHAFSISYTYYFISIFIIFSVVNIRPFQRIKVWKCQLATGSSHSVSTSFQLKYSGILRQRSPEARTCFLTDSTFQWLVKDTLETELGVVYLKTKQNPKQQLQQKQ